MHRIICIRLPEKAGVLLLGTWLALFVLPSIRAAESPLTFESSNTNLVNGFNYAKPTALGYVQTGKSPNYIPCYWAGGLNRPAFYARDTAHQLTGAHLLGLDLENFSMIQSFAASATPARKYYTLWSIAFDGSIFPTDYVSDNDFVRELPTPFDLLRRAYEQYLWTGDRRWIDDPTLWQFYAITTNQFLQLHEDQNGIAKESGSDNIFIGVASYNEQSGDHLTEAGDSFGCEYQAFLAYAGIQLERGDVVGAGKSWGFAEYLQTFFNQNWYSTTAGTYIRGFNIEGQPLTNWGKENSFFMPLTLVTAPGSRTDDFLQYIDQQMATANGEAQSYLPELYYGWGQPDTAEKWLLKIITNPGSTTTPGDRSYPEFSFTYISGLIGGMLGVHANAPVNYVSTLNNLASDTQWAASDHIPVGSHDIYVRQDRGAVSGTTVRHNQGTGTLVWQAGFYGNYPWLIVNGFRERAQSQMINGIMRSTVTVPLPVGYTVTVETPPGSASR